MLIGLDRKMLVTLICLTLVIIVATDYVGILNNINEENGSWKEVAQFWGNVVCRTGRTRILSLYETVKIKDSERLKDFFEDLTANINSQCPLSMITKTHHHDLNSSSYDLTNFSSLRENNEDKIAMDPPVFIEKSDDNSTTLIDNDTRLFPLKDVDILVMLMNDFEKILMNIGIMKNLHHQRHVLVIVITKKKISDETTKTMIDTFVMILQRLWQERQILNVFIVAPLSTFQKLIWFYDPFVKNTTIGVRGKIFALQVSSVPSIDRAMNLHGYKLNVGLFEHYLTVMKNDVNGNDNVHLGKKTNGFSGVDAMTMFAISEYMNFEVNIVPPMDGIQYGYVSDNGTWIGSIGDVAQHKVDISFNEMFAETSGLAKTDGRILFTFTKPIDFDRVCIIVPRALKIPRWLRTFYYYHPAIWACLLITHILVTLVWYFLRKIDDRLKNRVRASECYFSLLLATFFLIVGAPIKQSATQIERIFLVGLLFFGITIMGTFTGTLYHTCTNEMHYRDISDLKELDKSGMSILTVYANMHDLFGSKEIDHDDLPEIQNLARKLILANDTNNSSIISDTAYKRNVASLLRKSTFAALKHIYIDESGSNMLHVIPNCPRSYYLSYIVPIDSVYLDRFNSLIDRLTRGGFPKLWRSMMIDNVRRASIARRYSKDRRAPFNFSDVQTAFWILGIGHFIAVCIFIAETRFAKKRRSLINRSNMYGKIIGSRRNRVIRNYSAINFYQNERIMRGQRRTLRF